MNIDIETIKKEIKYISLKIRKCKDMYELDNLMFAFTILNVIHYHFTKEYVKEPSSPFINKKQHLEHYNDLIYADDVKLLDRYENEKLYLMPAFIDYVEKFESCPEEIIFPPTDRKIYTPIEAKKMILDFFSMYDPTIYSIVESMFNNKQIQVGIHNTDYISSAEKELCHFMSSVDELYTEDFTSETINPFVKRLIEISIECDTKDLSSEECVKMLHELKDLYEKLIPKDPKYIKKTIEFDEIGETSAFAYRIISLEKVYLLLTHKEFDLDNIITLVHELGHAIEDYLTMDVLKKRNNSDSNYLAEVSSSFFEYEFINYLIDNGIEEENAKYSLFNFYLDCAVDMIALLDTMDSIPDTSTYNENIEYEDKNGKRFTIDIQNRIKYGYNKYLAMLLSKKHHDNEEEFFRIFSDFMRSREELSSIELFAQAGISEEEFYNPTFFDQKLFSLIKIYDN